MVFLGLVHCATRRPTERVHQPPWWCNLSNPQWISSVTWQRARNHSAQTNNKCRCRQWGRIDDPGVTLYGSVLCIPWHKNKTHVQIAKQMRIRSQILFSLLHSLIAPIAPRSLASGLLYQEELRAVVWVVSDQEIGCLCNETNVLSTRCQNMSLQAVRTYRWPCVTLYGSVLWIPWHKHKYYAYRFPVDYPCFRGVARPIGMRPYAHWWQLDPLPYHGSGQNLHPTYSEVRARRGPRRCMRDYA